MSPVEEPIWTAVMQRASVVKLQGEFDLADRQRLADAFEVAASDPIVIVDLGLTAYMDSTILRELVKLRNMMALRTGKLLLTKPTGSVWRLFDVTQVGGLFEMCAGVEAQLTDLDVPRDAVRLITLVGKQI
jgi:anti-anti-sigma factor